MLSRNLYKVKKAPLSDKRKKAIISVVLVFSLFFIVYGLYSFKRFTPSTSGKQEIKQDIGDRPLKKSLIVYINADKGLSLRKDRDQNSERLAVIPDKTKLETLEELEGWYKVNYGGKEGWIAKQYVTLDEPAVDQFKDWSKFSGAFTIKYPLGWKIKDYGANEASKVSSLVAFSNQELPETIPEGSDFLAPVTVKVSSLTFDEAKKNYSSISGVAVEPISIGGLNGEKYTYISAYSNTQMTGIVVSDGNKVVIFDEGGGYAEDLMNMIKTFSLGG